MHNDKIKLFDEFFTTNYKYLISFSKSINPQSDYESLTHDVFLRCRQRIQENGYSGETYLNYVRVGLMNLYKSNYRQEKKHQFIDIEDPDYFNLTEDHLSLKAEQDQQQEEQNNINTYLILNVYEYLDKYASPKELWVFRTYYLLRHHHINYKELSKITGYSITSVSNIIKRLKKELRNNLELYIRTGINMDELLKVTEELLKEPINAGNYEKYKEIYKRIYGLSYRGCECKRIKLQNEIENWWKQNK